MMNTWLRKLQLLQNNKVWYLQDLGAILDPLVQPGIQDTLHWSETSPVIQGGEQAHAYGAGESRWGGYPAASFIEWLHRSIYIYFFKSWFKMRRTKLVDYCTWVEWCRLSCLYGVEAGGVCVLLPFKTLETNSSTLMIPSPDRLWSKSKFNWKKKNQIFFFKIHESVSTK